MWSARLESSAPHCEQLLQVVILLVWWLHSGLGKTDHGDLLPRGLHLNKLTDLLHLLLTLTDELSNLVMLKLRL